MVPWYHVCGYCNAKWFGQEVALPCPRCGELSEAGERVTPPWKQNKPQTQKDPAPNVTDADLN